MGMCGHPRWRIPFGDADDSVSEEEDNDIREHQHEKKAANIEALDIAAFLERDADLQDNITDDVELPPEFLEFDGTGNGNQEVPPFNSSRPRP